MDTQDELRSLREALQVLVRQVDHLLDNVQEKPIDSDLIADARSYKVRGFFAKKHIGIYSDDAIRTAWAITRD